MKGNAEVIVTLVYLGQVKTDIRGAVVGVQGGQHVCQTPLSVFSTYNPNGSWSSVLNLSGYRLPFGRGLVMWYVLLPTRFQAHTVRSP